MADPVPGNMLRMVSESDQLFSCTYFVFGTVLKEF